MSTSSHAQISDTELKERHEQVPVDYYHLGVRRNLFQKIWHQRREPVVHTFLSGRGGRLLDLGCHGGYLTSIIARESGARVTGIDIAAEAVVYARQKNPDLTFVVGDLQDPLPFPDQAFEVVTAFDVLEHVPRLEQVFTEIHRVLTPGGSFVIGVPRDTVLFRTVWKLWTKIRGAVWEDVHVHDFNSDDLRKTAQQHGFTTVREEVSHWGMYLAMEFRRQP